MLHNEYNLQNQSNKQSKSRERKGLSYFQQFMFLVVFEHVIRLQMLNSSEICKRKTCSKTTNDMGHARGANAAYVET